MRAKETVNATVEVMLYPGPTRYERGDVLIIARTNRVPLVSWDGAEYKTEGGVLMPRTGYVHVLNVPQEYFINFRNRINRPKRHPTPDPEDQHAGAIQHKRRWQLQVNELAAGVRQQLLDEKEITQTWLQFKNKVRHKISGSYLTDAYLGETNIDPEI